MKRLRAQPEGAQVTSPFPAGGAVRPEAVGPVAGRVAEVLSSLEEVFAGGRFPGVDHVHVALEARRIVALTFPEAAVGGVLVQRLCGELDARQGPIHVLLRLGVESEPVIALIEGQAREEHA